MIKENVAKHYNIGIKSTLANLREQSNGNLGVVPAIGSPSPGECECEIQMIDI